jgi:hypothetical protein
MTPRTRSISRSSALAALALAALFAGCEVQATCDAVGSSLQVNAPEVAMSKLETSGVASSQPVCILPAQDAGACTTYAVSLNAAGTCVLVATAIDGRQSVATVDVHLVTGGPCGPFYAADHPVTTFDFPFLESDAAAPDGADN